METMTKQVHIGGPSPGKSRKTLFSIPVKAMLAQVDGDGDGKLSRSEQELVETLRGMDTDGDGELELQEIISLGKGKIADKKSIANLKNMIILLVFLCLVFCGVMVGLMVLANEASKDSKPQGIGQLKTIAGKDVGTGVSKTVGGLGELVNMDKSQLKNVKEIVVNFPVAADGFDVFQIARSSMRYKHPLTGEDIKVLSLVTGDGILITITAASVMVHEAPSSMPQQNAKQRSLLGDEAFDALPADLQNRDLRYQKPMQSPELFQRHLLSSSPSTDTFSSSTPVDSASGTSAPALPVSTLGDTKPKVCSKDRPLSASANKDECSQMAQAQEATFNTEEDSNYPNGCYAISGYDSYWYNYATYHTGWYSCDDVTYLCKCSVGVPVQIWTSAKLGI